MRTDLKRPYNQTDNPVDTTSEDFRNVMEWLRGFGIPYPAIVTQEVGTPGGVRWQDIQLMWTMSNRVPLVQQAHLVMNHPSVTVTDFDLWMGQYPGRRVEEYSSAGAAKEPMPPPPPPPPPVESRPGGLAVGQIYYARVGDGSPNGTVWQDPQTGEKFVKRVVDTPFGKSVYWRKE